MNVLNHLSDQGLKRFFKVLLKRTIGNYLDGELSLEQLIVNSSENRIEVHNLQLNVLEINKYLATTNFPLQCISGKFDLLFINYSLSNIFADGFNLQINCLELKLSICSGNDNEDDCRMERSDVYDNPTVETEPLFSSEGQLGLLFVSNWIENVFSHLHISCDKIILDIFDGTSADLKQIFQLNLKQTMFSNNSMDEISEKEIEIAHISFHAFINGEAFELFNLRVLKIMFCLTNKKFSIILEDVYLNIDLMMAIFIKDIFEAFRCKWQKKTNEAEWLSSGVLVDSEKETSLLASCGPLSSTLNESIYFDAKDGPPVPNVGDDVSEMHWIICISTLNITFSQSLESLEIKLCGIDVYLDFRRENEIYVTETNAVLCQFFIFRKLTGLETRFSILERSHVSCLPVLDLHVSFSSRRNESSSTKIEGKCDSLVISFSLSFADYWRDFFSDLLLFNQPETTATSLLEVLFHIPSINLYIIANSDDKLEKWRQVSSVASPWIYGDVGRKCWFEIPFPPSIGTAYGGLYINFTDITLQLEHLGDSCNDNIQLSHIDMGCFVSSSLHSESSIASRNSFFSTRVVDLSSPKDNAISITMKSCFDFSANSLSFLLSVFVNKVDVDLKKHQFDIFIAIVRLLTEEKVSTCSVVEPPKYQNKFGVFIHSEYSFISLGDDGEGFLEKLLEHINSFQHLQYVSNFIKDRIITRNPHVFRLCLAVQKPCFNLSFGEKDTVIDIKANDLKMFEMDQADLDDFRERVFNHYDSFGVPIISRTDRLHKDSLHKDAFNINISFQNPVGSFSSTPIQSVNVKVDFEDICVNYDPSSVWFLEVAALLTVNTPNQLISSVFNSVKVGIKEENISENELAILHTLSQFTSFKQNLPKDGNLFESAKFKSDVEVTKISLCVKSSVFRYCTSASELMLCGVFSCINLSTSVLSNTPSLSIKTSFDGLQLAMTDSTKSILSETFPFNASEKLVDLDHLQLVICISENSKTSVDIDFKNCVIDFDIGSLDCLLDLISIGMKDIEKAKSKSDDVVQKYKLLKDDTLIFSHQSVQSKFQKVRVCDVVEIAPVVIPNFLLESVLEDDTEHLVQQSQHQTWSGSMINNYFNKDSNSFDIDYSPFVATENDSVFGSLLNSSRQDSVAFDSNPKKRVFGSYSSPDTSFIDGSLCESKEANNPFQKDFMVELESIRKDSVGTENLEIPVISGNDCDNFCSDVSSDNIEDIWKRNLVDNSLSNLKEDWENESRWFVHADELEILHDYVPIFIDDFNNVDSCDDSKQLQVVVRGNVDVKIFSRESSSQRRFSSEGGITESNNDTKVITSSVAEEQDKKSEINHAFSTIFLRFRNASIQHILFTDCEDAISPNSITVCSLKDFLVSYENSLLGAPYKVLGSWLSSTKKRDPYKPMLMVKISGYSPNKRKCDTEYRVEINMLPLRCYLDYNVISCIRWMAEILKKTKNIVDQPKPETHQLFFQSCSTNSIDIKIDYRATYLNLSALRKGDFCELLNIFPIDGLELTLQPASLTGVNGIERLSEMLAEIWVKDIYSNQFYRIISGITPLRGISKIGSNLQDIIRIPLSEYRSDKSLSRHISLSTKILFSSIARETLDVSHKVTKFVATTITDLAADPEQISWESSNRRYLKQNKQPKGLQEGLQEACRSVNRGCTDALESIVAIPVQQYDQTTVNGNRNGLVTTVTKLLPLAILRPVAGVVEGLSYTLLGLRNNIDPESRLNDEDVWNIDFD